MVFKVKLTLSISASIKSQIFKKKTRHGDSRPFITPRDVASEKYQKKINKLCQSETRRKKFLTAGHYIFHDVSNCYFLLFNRDTWRIHTLALPCLLAKQVQPGCAHSWKWQRHSVWPLECLKQCIRATMWEGHHSPTETLASYIVQMSLQ